MKRKTLAIALGAALSASLAATAQADKLDDIIESGKLRCAVTLDFPPMGFRDADNNPAGFDVDYCADLAKVRNLEVKLARGNSLTTPYAICTVTVPKTQRIAEESTGLTDEACGLRHAGPGRRGRPGTPCCRTGNTG